MGSKSTTTQNNSPYAPAQPMIDQGLRDAQAMYESGGFNISPYQGDLVADADALSSAAYGMTPGVANASLSGSMAAQQGLMGMMDPNARSSAFDQVRQNVIDTVSPQINSAFAGSGMTGSTLHAQNLAKGMTAGLADVENQAYQQGQQRALQAASMMPAINQSMYHPLSYMREVGDERRQLAQAEIQAAALQDQQAKTADLAALQDYMALSTGAGSTFGVQSSTSRQSPGLFGMLGAGLQAAPLLFPSDRRVKTNIEPMGQRKGLNWYSFRYLWDAPGVTRQGVMSDEVPQEAVMRHPSGFDVVDYAQLGVAP